MRLVVEGKRDREIAATLFLSHRTVENHVLHILTKLGVESPDRGGDLRRTA